MTVKYLLLGIFVVAVFAIGFTVGHFSTTDTAFIENKNPPNMNTPKQSEEVVGTSTTQGETPVATGGLSGDQIKMLQALGIDVNTITPSMITCAETSLGTSRVAEIKKGASLSFTEKAKLVACYK